LPFAVPAIHPSLAVVGCPRENSVTIQLLEQAAGFTPKSTSQSLCCFPPSRSPRSCEIRNFLESRFMFAETCVAMRSRTINRLAFTWPEARKLVRNDGPTCVPDDNSLYQGCFFGPGLTHCVTWLKPISSALRLKRTAHAAGVPHSRGKSSDPVHSACAALAFSLATCTTSGKSCRFAEAISIGPSTPRTSTRTLCNFAVPVTCGSAKLDGAPVAHSVHDPAIRRSICATPPAAVLNAGNPNNRATRNARAISASPLKEMR